MANYYKFQLKAGVAIQVPIAGKVILVDDIGVAPGLDITPMFNGAAGITMPKRQTAFKVFVDYDTVTLAAPVDCTVALFLSQSDVSLGFTNGSSINVQGQVTIGNGPGARVPVDLQGGNVTVNAANVGINNDDAHPVPVRGVLFTTVVDYPAAVVNTGAAQPLISDAALKRLRVRNAHATASVAIGGANVTMQKAALILGPGDTWSEEDAAGAAWFAVSDTDGADVRLQGIKP